MGFENGLPPGAYPAPPPDFTDGIKTYTEQVENLGVRIKEAQSQLADVLKQIEDAKAQRQLIYQTQRIEPLEDKIFLLINEITALQEQHDQWVIKADGAQQQFNSISLDFSQKQKELDASWADFHIQSNQLLADQKQLKVSQDSSTVNQAQLTADRATFESYKNTVTAQLEDQKQNLDTLTAQAQKQMADANDKMKAAIEVTQDTEAKQTALVAKIDAAQSILAEADAVAKQKIQNDIDAKTNAAQAIQNQNDANQIKVAKVVLNNQQQEYNSRMQTLLAAEAALKTGG